MKNIICFDCENCEDYARGKVYCGAKCDWVKPREDCDKCNNYLPKYEPERYGDND